MGCSAFRSCRTGHFNKARRLAKFASLLLVIALSAACSPVAGLVNRSLPASATPCSTPEPDGEIKICTSGEGSPTATDIPQVGPQPAVTLPASAPPSSPTPLPATATLAPSPIPTLAACDLNLCTFSASLFLSRPLSRPDNPRVDPTYRFGSTFSGLKEPHHGVEFPIAFGAPVLAAGGGVVVVAGNDMEPTSARGVWPITYFGPYFNFYGNLIIIEHALPPAMAQLFPDAPQPVYSLYAHLSEIHVQVGESVTAGQIIGKVGMSGIAEGPHLHFEVRLGKDSYTSYTSSHNPELWLYPNIDESGTPLGALAVRFIDAYGAYIEVPSISIEYLPGGPDQPAETGNDAFPPLHLVTYEEKGLRGQPPFYESLGINDLPPGWYRINYPREGMQQVLAQVFAEKLTLTTIPLP